MESMLKEMEGKEKYIPVSCAFYDELELYSMRKTICEIVYELSPDVRTKVVGKIVDLYTRDHVEYLLLDSGLEIRLDHIKMINDQLPGDFC